MTQEEKAKCYDEAIEIARQIHGADRVSGIELTICEEIFPELAESEDERMLKVTMQFTNENQYKNTSYKGRSYSKEAILTWLEKQGEQKFANKVGPKFKVGQWIVWHDKCYKVNYNGCGYELVDQNGLRTSLEYVTFDENAHLWDIIQDAKCGDVLANDNRAFIYNGKISPSKDLCGAFCGISDRFALGQTECEWAFTEYVTPATKEQRDTLLKAMADAGYTFDFDKKELKKIEQIAWGKEDDRSLDSVLNDLKQGVIPDSDDINWLKSLKDRIQHQSKRN